LPGLPALLDSNFNLWLDPERRHGEKSVSGLFFTGLEGTGTIDGAGDYAFLTSEAAGGSRSGRFRLRIWDEATGAIAYDSQPGAAVDAAPSTPVHRGKIALKVRKHRK
jgi:hypothetical protein